MRALINEIRETFFNYNKPSEQILSDLIFATNGFRLPATGVTYGVPVAITPSITATIKLDTAITVSIPWVPGIQNWGQKTFFYTRIHLGSLAPICNPPGIAVASYPTDTYTLLPQINAFFGTQLTQADLLNTVYATSAGPFTLTANPTSLIVQGNGDAAPAVIGSTDPAGSYTPGSGPSTGTGPIGGETGDGSGSGTGGTGSDGTGTGSDGTGSGGSGTGNGSDGSSPELGPDWEPNGESGAQDGP